MACTEREAEAIRQKLKANVALGGFGKVIYMALCCPRVSEQVYMKCAFTFAFMVKFFSAVYLIGNVAFVQFFLDDDDSVKLYMYLAVYMGNFFILLYKPLIILIGILLLMIISFIFVIFLVIYKLGEILWIVIKRLCCKRPRIT